MTKVQSHNGFVYTTAIKKLRKLKKRTKVIPGGTSGGKTFGIIPILIDDSAKIPNLETSIVSESIPHLRKGAMKDFLKIMKKTGRYIDSNWNKTHLTYTFSNGSYIEFFSADQEDKVRGPRRNRLYCNEVNNLKFDTFHQLAIRTSDSIWADFNPSNEFWAYNELKEDEDTEWLTLTYKDNEGLPDSIVKEIEKAKYKAYINPDLEGALLFHEDNIKNKFWDNWWRVYGLGMLGMLDGVILSNWGVIKDIPEEAEYLGTGLDFGYTNDPSAIVDIYKWNGKRIVDEVLYAKGQDNDMLADAIGDRNVYADSAEPKSIDYIEKKRKKTIKGVIKGPDSVKFGLELMQKQDYLITERSVNLIREARGYCWDKNKSGEKLNKPADGQSDHGIDAWRYVEVMLLGKAERNISFGDDD